MFSIDEVNSILDEIAATLPTGIFSELNGGVSLVPNMKKSASDPDGRLFTLGEYRHDQMGRYIVIYYGSICVVHGSDTRDELRESLRQLLVHELTHHIESLAGERDLELEDKRKLDEYFGME